MSGHSDQWCPIDPCDDCIAEQEEREQYEAQFELYQRTRRQEEINRLTWEKLQSLMEYFKTRRNQ